MKLKRVQESASKDDDLSESYKVVEELYNNPHVVTKFEIIRRVGESSSTPVGSLSVQEDRGTQKKNDAANYHEDVNPQGMKKGHQLTISELEMSPPVDQKTQALLGSLSIQEKKAAIQKKKKAAKEKSQIKVLTQEVLGLQQENEKQKSQFAATTQENEKLKRELQSLPIQKNAEFWMSVTS
ncbi:hypothetical protein Tco_0208347 [Tanacetum coccineum]